MKPSDKTSALLSIRLVATQAAKLADDLEKGRLWESDYESELAKIQTALNSAKKS